MPLCNRQSYLDKWDIYGTKVLLYNIVISRKNSLSSKQKILFFIIWIGRLEDGIMG